MWSSSPNGATARLARHGAANFVFISPLLIHSTLESRGLKHCPSTNPHGQNLSPRTNRNKRQAARGELEAADPGATPEAVAAPEAPLEAAPEAAPKAFACYDHCKCTIGV